MSTKPKLEVIELSLGIDATLMTQKQPLNDTTVAKAGALKEHYLTEKRALDRVRNSKKEEDEKKRIAAEKVYDKLAELAPNNGGLTTPEILQIAENDDHVGIMVRLSKYVKERGSLWKVQKGKKNNQTIYRFKLSQQGSATS